MTTILPPHPDIVRYLRALSTMTTDVDPENRRYAREAMRDMATPGVYVTEYMRPVITLPLPALVGPERRHRLLAEGEVRA